MPKENYRNPAEYYASHSLITDPKEYRHLLADIPSSVSEMVEILQGLFLHIFGQNATESHLLRSKGNTCRQEVCGIFSRLLTISIQPSY